MKTIIALALATLFLSGCTAARVEVNAWSKDKAAVRAGQSLKLALAPARPPENALLNREIAAKLTKALKDLGHRIDETSPLVMNYEYGVGPAQQRTEMRTVREFGGFEYVGYVDGQGRRHYRPVPLPDITRYEPVHYVVYPKYLNLKLIRFSPGRTETLWAAEISMDSYGKNLRRDIDYLIVAGLGKLGEDTKRAVSVDIGFDDERVDRLRGE